MQILHRFAVILVTFSGIFYKSFVNFAEICKKIVISTVHFIFKDKNSIVDYFDLIVWL